MSGAQAQRDAVVTIKIPFAVRKRGGRKLVLAPDGAPVPLAVPHVDSTLVKAIARAFRWQRMLETGRYATVSEIAKAERINPSYVSPVLDTPRSPLRKESLDLQSCCGQNTPSTLRAGNHAHL